MMRGLVDVLRVLLIAAMLLIGLLQVVALPWLSGVMAADLPAEAYMRWPMLVLSILGLTCVQVGIACTVRLLGITRRGAVFQRSAVGWVDGIIGAFLAGSALCLGTLLYVGATVSGPPLFSIALLAASVGGVGLALLMVVMRSLLLQAAGLRSELDVVI